MHERPLTIDGLVCKFENRVGFALGGNGVDECGIGGSKISFRLRHARRKSPAINRCQHVALLDRTIEVGVDGVD